MKKENKQKFTPILLDDDPVEIDDFTGKAHERVSKSLYNTIISNGEGGYAIGLEGSWGSGKSSVIRMLKNMLEKDKNLNSILYTFDTYGHIGDPMKRSFLNRLIEFLKYKGVLCKFNKRWGDLIKEINAQIEVMVVKRIPRVPLYLYLMAFYLLLLPFILLSINFFSNPENGIVDPEMSTEIIKWLIVFGIGYPVVITMVTWLWRQLPWARHKGVVPVPSLRFTETQTSGREYIKKSSSDTSSIEFNKYFKEIISSIGNKKLIVVIDNLDRLEFGDVREIWGSLRNFFTSVNDENDVYAKALKKVILVVPYDKNSIHEAFKRKNSNEAGFIEKTFKTIIRVPEPIITDWKEFLEYELTTKAFKGLSLNEGRLHDIFRYFDLYFTSSRNNISPRSIKFLINEMVVFYYQWGDEIPLKYIALYVTIRKKIESANILNPGEFLPNDLYSEFSDDKEWYMYIIALHYSINPKNVMHLVISRRIIEIVSNSEGKELENLRKYNGLFVIFEKAIRDNSFKSNFKDVPEKLLKFIINTKGLNVPPQFINRPREIFFHQIINISNYSDEKVLLLKSSYLVKGIISLAELYETNEVRGKKLISLLNAITPQSVDVSTESNKKIEITTLTFYWKLMEEAIGYLYNCFENKEDFNASILKVKLPDIDPFSPLTNTYMLYKCWEKYDINLLSFDQDYLQEDLIDFLEDQFSNETFDKEKVVEVTKHILNVDTDKANNHIDSLLKIIATKIKELAEIKTSNENERNLILLLQTLFIIEEVLPRSIDDTIRSLNNHKCFHKLWRYEGIKNHIILFPQILYKILKFGEFQLKTTDVQQHRILNSVTTFHNNLLSGRALDEDMLKHIIKLGTRKYQSIILPLAKDNPRKYQLYKQLAQGVIKSGELNNESLIYLIKHFNNYPFGEEEVKRAFFKRLELVPREALEYLKVTDIPIPLLTDLKDENKTTYNQLINFIKTKLTKFTSSEWEQIFEEMSHEHEYLKFLKGEKFLDKEFKNQLLSIVKEAYNKDELSVTNQEILSAYPTLLKKRVELEFYTQAQAELINSYRANWRFNSEVIDIIGQAILKPYPPISKDHANSYMKNLVSPFITDDVFALGWLEFNMDNIKPFFNIAISDVKKEIEEDLNRVYQKIKNRTDLDNKDELIKQLQNLASTFKINLIEND